MSALLSALTDVGLGAVILFTLICLALIFIIVCLIIYFKKYRNSTSVQAGPQDPIIIYQTVKISKTDGQTEENSSNKR